MEYVTLGNTGLRVSKLCFGTLTLSPLQRDLDIEAGAALLKSAFDKGVTFFDTAEIYGTYAHLKKAFSGNEDAVISTKSYSYDAKTAKESLDKARKGLGRDYIDIFMLHEQESEYTLKGHKEAIDYFLKMKQQGIIKALGISTHFVAGVKAAARHIEIDAVHMIYNMRGLGVADGTREEMEAAVKEAWEAGKGIFAMKPLGGGHLCGGAGEAFAYAAGSPHVHSVAVGMQNIEEVRQNCAYFSGDRNIVFSLKEKRRIMVHDWCEACGRCARACASGALSIKDGKVAIDQQRCVFCGYCGAVCPQFAIKVI